MTHAPTTPPPEGLRDTCDVCPAPANCWREPEGTAACPAHVDHPTVRPDKGPCGRIHIAGFDCPTCAAPQWVARPAKEGIWWVWDGKGVDLMHIGRFDVNGEECWSHQRVLSGESKRGRELPGWWRFLDARITPPAPPEAR